MKDHFLRKLSILLVLTLLLAVIPSLSVQALTSNEMISKIDAKYAQNTWLGAATTGYETG